MQQNDRTLANGYSPGRAVYPDHAAGHVHVQDAAEVGLKHRVDQCDVIQNGYSTRVEDGALTHLRLVEHDRRPATACRGPKSGALD